ncbi:MAG: PDZ domain-containing protein, partial [Alphaproteobacteria bacterium]|nr:PDZ domain-containing protein [Alphaproteobacteria bacterium]
HAVDSRTDIAVLAIDLKNLDFNIEKLKSVTWGDSSKLNEGNFVVAIGNPFGLGSTVTNGIVSAKGRNLSMGMPSLNFIDDFIQHSAPINFGNSGGCLLNIYGEVIGINNAIFSTSGGNIGIGFAIPSNIAKNTVDQLIKFKRTFRGWLGAEVHSVYAKQAESVGLTKHSLESSKIFGAYVARVVPNGPAAKCGIKVGDIIVEFNGKRISENCSLQNAVGTAEIGKSVKLKIWRQKDNSTWGMIEIPVKIGDFEKAMQSGELDTKTQEESGNADVIKETHIDSLGITISALPEQYKSDYPKGVKVVVTKVEDDESPSFYGPIFKVGDGFISADNKQVTSVPQMKGIVENILKDKNNRNRPIPFVVAREGSQMMIATTLDFAAKENDEK